MQITELDSLCLDMWPVLRMLQLVMSMQVLYASQKLVTEAASISHVSACISLLRHVVPVSRPGSADC